MWQKIKMVIKKMLGVYLGMITFALTIAVILEIMKHNIVEMLLGIAMTTFFAFLTYICFKKPQYRNNVITSTQSQNANNGNDIVSTFAATSQEILHNNADIPKTTEESVKYLGPRDNTIIVQTDEQNISNEEISHNVTLNKPQPAHNPDITPVTSQEIQQNSIYHKETTDKVTGYVTTENIITRTDEKEISDKDIPYLMQIGYENALKEQGLYIGQTLDTSFIQEQNRKKSIYTTIPSYEELYSIERKKPKTNLVNLRKEPESNASNINSIDLQFLKYINGLTVEKPFIAQYWFYDYNVNYSETIKKLITNDLLCIKNINIKKFKVDELKNILRHFNLSLTGKKKNLQERIYNNLTNDDLSNFLPSDKHYFMVTEKGINVLNTVYPSATKNIDLEDMCIDFITQYNFRAAYSLIEQFKLNVPAKNHLPTYNTNMDKCFSNIMDSRTFYYTLEKDRDIEVQIRAAIVFCRMYGSGQDNIKKIIKRMYIENGHEFSNDAENIIRGRLL